MARVADGSFADQMADLVSQTITVKVLGTIGADAELITGRLKEVHLDYLTIASGNQTVYIHIDAIVYASTGQ